MPERITGISSTLFKTKRIQDFPEETILNLLKDRENTREIYNAFKVARSAGLEMKNAALNYQKRMQELTIHWTAIKKDHPTNMKVDEYLSHYRYELDLTTQHLKEIDVSLEIANKFIKKAEVLLGEIDMPTPPTPSSAASAA